MHGVETGVTPVSEPLVWIVSTILGVLAVAGALTALSGFVSGRPVDQRIESATPDLVGPSTAEEQTEGSASSTTASSLATSSLATSSPATSSTMTHSESSSDSTSTAPASSTTQPSGASSTQSDITTTTVASTSNTSSTTVHTADHPTSTTPATSSTSSTSSTVASGGSGDDHHSGSNAGLASISNTNPLFSRYSSVPSSALDLEALTEPTSTPDNGSVGDGQFRMACQYSHFAYDDPIVFPGQPGRSHLHMFFGNTLTNAHTTASSLLDTGGGTCNGFELNRSAYWTPALLDGNGNAVVPEHIILYYKTKFPAKAQPLPVGLKMISGSTGSSFSVSHSLYWSCGGSGHAYNKSNRIPDCGGDIINASIAFPECWDGRNLDSADHRSHLRFVDGLQECPSSHPVRLPQISILLYYPGQSSIDGWHLSADGHHGDGPPGGSLHADWFGGWNDEALNLWIDGCITRARNCSYGQTGTNRRFAPLNGMQNYPGPHILPLP